VVGGFAIGLLCGAGGTWLLLADRDAREDAPPARREAPKEPAAEKEREVPEETGQEQDPVPSERVRLVPEIGGRPDIDLPHDLISPLEPVPGVVADPDSLGRLAQDARAEPERRIWALRALLRMDPEAGAAILARLRSSSDGVERRIAAEVGRPTESTGGRGAGG
jgi:hypothetical protein